MKSGNLNFLEPSGPLQACTGRIYLYTRRMITEIWISGLCQRITTNYLLIHGLFFLKNLLSGIPVRACRLSSSCSGIFNYYPCRTRKCFRRYHVATKFVRLLFFYLSFGLDAIYVTFCGFRRQTSADINPIFIFPLSCFWYKGKSVPYRPAVAQRVPGS